ncbi:adaptor protein MecA [Streptococcus sciuri]|uniref:Adapter protein MecA n=1 Tax=Streptococcus sciuri TaxID=2973939 RepID=A0ABT2F9Z5_9STRE|nr:adaptor protein MecA [Streptococcus sciuri]MCS4488652.1 adaptor protein MecA [Streptococcus sciuri]
MEMKQISETTLKIIISMEDLADRGMELKDFLLPQEKTEEFFYSVMDELDLPDNFKNSGMLSFRVTPRKDRIDVFVTKSEIDKNLNFDDLAEFGDVSKMSPEEFFKTLETSMQSKGDTQAHKKLEQLEQMMENALENSTSSDQEMHDEIETDYVHYVFFFSTLEDTIAFSKVIDFEIEASELYKEQSGYYMTILLDIKNQPSNYANLMYARLLEHASQSKRTRAYLQEHGVQLIADDAIRRLQLMKIG